MSKINDYFVTCSKCGVGFYTDNKHDNYCENCDKADSICRIEYDDEYCGNDDIVIYDKDQLYNYRIRIMSIIENEMDELAERKNARPLGQLTTNEKNEYDVLKRLYIKIMNEPFDKSL